MPRSCVSIERDLRVQGEELLLRRHVLAHIGDVVGDRCEALVRASGQIGNQLGDPFERNFLCHSISVPSTRSAQDCVVVFGIVQCPRQLG